MNAVIGLGKYLFAIPFLIFGILHFMSAGDMAGMAFGMPVLVYFTGLCQIAAAVSIFMGKYDKLAAVLLAVMLVLFALIVHAPNMSENPMELLNILKNIAMAGGALMYAGTLARDKSIIG